MKRFFLLWGWLLLFIVGCRSVPNVVTVLPDTAHIDNYGGLWLAISTEDFLAAGFQQADVVKLSLAGRTHVMPVVPSFRCVKAGSPALVTAKKPELPVCVTIFYGDAASRWHLAEKQETTNGGKATWKPADGIAFPLLVDIRLQRKGGYADQLALHSLQRSNRREDYPELTDDAFANFRPVVIGRIAPNRLYRSSSPLNPALGRASFADAAARRVGIQTILNMADTEAEAQAMDGAADTYCIGRPTLFVKMSVDVSQQNFASDLARGLRFLLERQPPYLIHCKEGQDRSGIACAIVALFMGATLEDVEQDYLATFINYYRIAPSSKSASLITESLRDNLKTAFGLRSLRPAKLQQAARAYLRRGGLTEAELDQLAQKLATN
jgi:protein tyrosine/serine phosphatase